MKSGPGNCSSKLHVGSSDLSITCYNVYRHRTCQCWTMNRQLAIAAKQMITTSQDLYSMIDVATMECTFIIHYCTDQITSSETKSAKPRPRWLQHLCMLGRYEATRYSSRLTETSIDCNEHVFSINSASTHPSVPYFPSVTFHGQFRNNRFMCPFWSALVFSWLVIQNHTCFVQAIAGFHGIESNITVRIVL